MHTYIYLVNKLVICVRFFRIDWFFSSHNIQRRIVNSSPVRGSDSERSLKTDTLNDKRALAHGAQRVRGWFAARATANTEHETLK